MTSEDNGAKLPLRFGKYALVERIAFNGMGEVFLAQQVGLEKTIVIKRVKPSASQKSLVRKYLDEAKLASQLHHPNIVQIYDLGRVGSSYFVAMEYVFGRDMRRILLKAETLKVPFPLALALRVASSACEGLYYAHERKDLCGNALNIVHRDISPEHIFLAFDGTVKLKLSGFGIAEPSMQPDPAYQSPEQCSGSTVDHRSDIFSLGTVLYEWITGNKLFTGNSRAAVIKALLENRIHGPSYYKPDIPEAVEQIVMKALARDRNARYETAHQMQSDIDRFLAKYEFMPSNIHLANFLKQLFSDELEEQRNRLMAVGQPLGEAYEQLEELYEDSSASPKPVPIPFRPKNDRAETSISSETSSEKVMTVSVDEQTYDSLKSIAERNQIPVGTLLRELLSNYVRYK